MKVISAFGTDGKPLTRAELGYEASLAFAEFFYVRSQPLFYYGSKRTRSHTGSPVRVADNVILYFSRTTWTLRDFFISLRVIVPWNQIRATAPYHSEEYELWGVDRGNKSCFDALIDP